MYLKGGNQIVQVIRVIRILRMERMNQAKKESLIKERNRRYQSLRERKNSKETARKRMRESLDRVPHLHTRKL